MLTSFHVSNFRLFQKIEVQKLSRVNLVVGKNNAGKSAFIEAVELYASNASPSTLLDIVESRRESWSSNVRKNTKILFRRKYACNSIL